MLIKKEFNITSKPRSKCANTYNMNNVKLKFVTLVILGLLIISALFWLYVIDMSQEDPCGSLPPCVKPCKKAACQDSYTKGCTAPCSKPPKDSLPPEMHQGIYLQGEILSNNMIIVNYQTPVGNTPKDKKNWIGLWEGNTIQAGQAPIKIKRVKDNGPIGILFLDSLQIEAVDYVVGYGMGQDSIPCDIASTLSFGSDLPLMTLGVPDASYMEVLESGDNHVLFQLHQSVGDCSLTNGHSIAIKYENTYQAPLKQNAANPFATPDSTQNYYASLEAPRSFQFIPSENIVQVDDELFIIKDYPTRQLEWYTMANINIVDQDTSIVSTCTFKVNPKKETTIN